VFLAAASLVAALLSVVAVSVVTASPASASGGGCTSAQGGVGAQNCIYVWGGGTHVDQARSTYWPAPTDVRNVCNRWHKFAYTPASDPSHRHYYTAQATGCIDYVVAQLTGDYYNIYPNNYFVNNSSFCAASKNSDTGNEWTPWACITVHS
jgi:hypothetical protein